MRLERCLRIVISVYQDPCNLFEGTSALFPQQSVGCRESLTRSSSLSSAAASCSTRPRYCARRASLLIVPFPRAIIAPPWTLKLAVLSLLRPFLLLPGSERPISTRLAVHPCRRTRHTKMTVRHVLGIAERCLQNHELTLSIATVCALACCVFHHFPNEHVERLC